MNILNVLAEAGSTEITGGTGMEALFTTIQTVITSFLSVVGSVLEFVMGNDLCLIFLGISFLGIAIRYMKRITFAFGRGR